MSDEPFPTVTEYLDDGAARRTRYEPAQGGWVAISERRDSPGEQWREVGNQRVEGVAFEHIPPEVVES
jgi:hypothetical protein